MYFLPTLTLIRLSFTNDAENIARFRFIFRAQFVTFAEYLPWCSANFLYSA